MIGVYVVEDDSFTLARIKSAILESDELDLVGFASTYTDALAGLDEVSPDILLTDLGLPDGHGLDLIRHVGTSSPTTLSMVLSMFGDEKNVVEAILAGAKGYLLKDDSSSDVVQAIVQLTEGASPVSPAIARYLLVKLQQDAHPETKQAQPKLLSPREGEVLELVAQGYRSKEIADRLDISYHTVVHHIRSVYDKLAVSSRSQAIFKASQLGELK